MRVGVVLGIHSPGIQLGIQPQAVREALPWI
jgi:hypothetical protein